MTPRASKTIGATLVMVMVGLWHGLSWSTVGGRLDGTPLRDAPIPQPFIIDRTPGVLYSVHVARKPHRCDDGFQHRDCYLHYPAPCPGWIEPGERYVRMALPPGELGNTSWWVLRRHADEIEGYEVAGKVNGR